jgi:hypothetical protein
MSEVSAGQVQMIIVELAMARVSQIDWEKSSDCFLKEQ